MRFYVSNGLLIRENPETKVIRVCNRTNKINTDNYIISCEDFFKMEKKELKKDKWSELMNNWFRDVKHEWVHNYTSYKKIDNFEQNNWRISDNYNLGKDVPYHNIKEKPYLGSVVLVYHWGNVYYHTVSYNGYAQGQLIDINTFEFVKWTQLKNCAPIFNIDEKKIC